MDDRTIRINKRQLLTQKVKLKRLQFSNRIRNEIKQAREDGNYAKASRLQSHLAWHINQIKARLN